MVGKNDETSHVNFTVRQNDNAWCAMVLHSQTNEAWRYVASLQETDGMWDDFCQYRNTYVGKTISINHWWLGMVVFTCFYHQPKNADDWWFMTLFYPHSQGTGCVKVSRFFLFLFGLRKSPAIFRPQETLCHHCHHKDHRTRWTWHNMTSFKMIHFFRWMLSLQWLQKSQQKT
jgi:hypothetical protein